MIWGRNSDTTWQPTQIMLSQHSGYQTIAWGSIQNTLNSGDETQNIGGPNGRQNLDHAKVYVAWAKHANYNTRNTGWNDVLSQLTDNAFRSQDWWYLPKASKFTSSPCRPAPPCERSNVGPCRRLPSLR